MPNGRLEIRHNFTGETGFVIVEIFKTTAPLTAASGYYSGTDISSGTATRATYSAPHDQRSLLIEELDPVMYLVRAYRSADGTTKDEEILTLAGDASSGSLFPITKIEYVVGRGEQGDPEPDDNGLRDERLEDQTYWVEERGTGTISEDEIIDRSDDGGGFDWVEAGKVFELGQRYFVTVVSRVAMPDEGSGSGSGDAVSDIVIIEEDTDFDFNTHANKLIVVDGSDPVVMFNLPDLLTMADCLIQFQTHGGTQQYLGIQFDTGDTVNFKGEARNVIWLGRGEELSIMIRGNAAYIKPGSVTGYDRLGQRIWGDKLELNTLYRDGTQYDQVDLPRLMEFVDTLEPGQVVTEAAWPNDKGKFARDDVAGTIRVPDSRGVFERALNSVTGAADSERATQGPGGTQNEAVKKFWTGSHATLNILKVDGTNTEVSTDSGAISPNIRFGVAIDQTIFGTETRPKNEGLLPLICI